MQQLHGFLPGWFPSRGRLVAARLVNRELAPIPTESTRATCDAAIPAKAKIDRADFGLEQWRSEEHTSELQSLRHLVCRLLLEKKKKITKRETKKNRQEQ